MTIVVSRSCKMHFQSPKLTLDGTVWKNLMTWSYWVWFWCYDDFWEESSNCPQLQLWGLLYLLGILIWFKAVSLLNRLCRFLELYDEIDGQGCCCFFPLWHRVAFWVHYEYVIEICQAQIFIFQFWHCSSQRYLGMGLYKRGINAVIAFSWRDCVMFHLLDITINSFGKYFMIDRSCWDLLGVLSSLCWSIFQQCDESCLLTFKARVQSCQNSAHFLAGCVWESNLAYAI